MNLAIPSAQLDPAAHAALNLAAGRLPDEVERPEGILDVLSMHGLIGAAAEEGGPGLAAAARPAHFRLLMRQRVMDRHRAEVVASLENAGIPAIVLKGRSAGRWYAHPDLRTSTDIDLLVPPDLADEAVAVIGRTSAVTDVPIKGPEADKRHIMFRDGSDVSFILDLHWHLFSYSQLRGRADSALPEVWAQVDRSELGWELPIGAEVAFLAAHAVLDHRFRLILFRDLAEIARAEPDWEEVGRFAERHGLRSLTWTALVTAKRFAGADIPDEFLADLRLGSLPERLYEWSLPRLDPVRFDGHSRHPLNLASVLLHDDRLDRIALSVRAPLAFGRWKHKPNVTHRRGVRRVLVVVTSNARRGAEVFGEALSQELRHRGWDVKLVCLSITDGPAVSAIPVGGSRHVLGKLSPRIVSALRSEMRNMDLVLLNGSAALRYGLAATVALPNRPPLVYGSIGEPAYWADSKGRRLMQRLLLNRVDVVGAVSEATREQLESIIGVDRAAIRYAPTGVETSAQFERDRGPDLPLRVVWVGSLSEEKRPMLLFEVLDRLRTPVSVRIVGDGPLRSDVEDRASIDDRVMVEGAVNDVTSILLASDVLVQTSATEGLPGVVMEAASIGIPSVAFDVGGTGELVLDGVTGRLIQNNDTAELAQALDDLNEDRGALASLGAAARRHVEEAFSLEEAVGRWEAIFEVAIQGNRR